MSKKELENAQEIETKQTKDEALEKGVRETGKRRLSKDRKDDNAFRHTFVLLFGKIKFRNEENFMNFLNWLIFIVLLVVEFLMLLQQLDLFVAEGGRLRLLVMIGLITLLGSSEAIQRFAVKNEKIRYIFYAVDALVACAFIFLVGGIYPLIIYMLVLTEFYISSEKMRFSFSVFGSCVLSYALCYGAQIAWKRWDFDFVYLLRESLGPVVALASHFVIVHIALAFYRQYLRLEKAIRELDESKQELEKAYAVVAEVTALEERQRIAKDIHDTAGHSITTVIMQTEAAKRIIEDNPMEAKSKIVAANLQAKHALEELRNSVHLLSGVSENKTFRDALLDIIHESTDGTGINIRSEIEDVTISEAKYRFLCNTLKEGISNGLRHGGATAFWFELKQRDGKLTFLLSDNGKGVDGELHEGFGLTTMRERVKSLGGQLTIHSEIDEGFEIEITLPMDTEEK